MKTTVEIHDALLLRAKRHARKNGTTLRSVIEAGLRRTTRRTLDEPEAQKPYEWQDLSVGDPSDPWPLEDYSWPELRELIYGDRG